MSFLEGTMKKIFYILLISLSSIKASEFDHLPNSELSKICSQRPLCEHNSIIEKISCKPCTLNYHCEKIAQFLFCVQAKGRADKLLCRDGSGKKIDWKVDDVLHPPFHVDNIGTIYGWNHEKKSKELENLLNRLEILEKNKDIS